MNILKMNKYGKVLTGREFGKKTALDLKKENVVFPVALDFSEIIAIAAAFGDEFLVFVAGNQDNHIDILNASKVVWECIELVAEDRNFSVSKKPLE